MSKIAIVYWSGTGNTEAMADAVAEGAKNAGADVTLYTAPEFSASMMDDFDAVAFGCPSMGAEQLEESEFEPMFQACESKLSGKKIALFGSYGWGVASITGIDISPEMAKLAADKFPEVNVICGDVETTDFGRQFDAVMVYNAFPHFPDPAGLIKTLAGLTKPGGRLSVAHGMSRAALIRHHERASKVSIDLIHEQELAALFAPYFDVDVVVSTDRMYQVSGVRRDGAIHSQVGHVHSHDHGHDHIHADTPMDELLTLMQFMVKHNDAHAQELAELAQQLLAAGKGRAYRSVMDTVSDFDLVNARLDAISKTLTMEDP